MAYVGVKPAAITSATEAEIAGDLTVDTNTLKVDATNNRVGIGTLSPDRSLHITSSEPSVVLENSGQGTDLKTWRMYSNSSSLQIGTVDDAFAAGQNALEITRDNTDNITGIQFKTGASSEIGRFTTDGLTFNGDTAAANALDDYEQGTWTPSVGGSATYTLQVGHYTKIGNQVFITGIILINSISGADHTNYLDGLPYNSVTGSGREGHISVQYFNNLATSGTYFALRTNGDRLYGSGQNANDGAMYINPTIFQNSTEISFGGSYFTS